MDSVPPRNVEGQANRFTGRLSSAPTAARRRALRCARAVLLVVGLTACGCGTVLFEVPPGMDVRLQAE